MYKNILNIKTIVFVSFAMVSLQLNAQITWPEVTQQAKPWARWWREGSAVNKEVLRNMSKAGYGL